MIEQTRQRFAARLTQLWLSQLVGRLPVHRIDRLTQSRIAPGELGRTAFTGKSLAVEVVQLANPMQPHDGPIDKLRPAFANADEIATHVSPTERQLHYPRLNLGHRLIGQGERI